MKHVVNNVNKKIYLKIVSVFAFICAVTFLIFVFYSSNKALNVYISDLMDTDKFYNGIIIGGLDVSGKSKEEAIDSLIDYKNKEQENININLLCGGKTITINGTQFDYTYNIDNVVDEAYNYAREGNIFKRYFDILNVVNNKDKFNIESNVSEESLEKNVNYVLNQFDDKELEAHVEKFNPDSNEMFIYSPGKDGMKLNRDEVKQQLEALARNRESGNIILKKYEVKNTSTIEDAKSRTQLIGEFKTVSTNSANSNQNMKISMDSINGTILNPGEVFSFNGIVGDSNDPKRGFLKGAAILNGSIVMAYGGGICQAATTIYGAAIRADMTIIERRNHRYKSSYVPYGLDATIDYNNIDLKFRNDLSYPVYIKTNMNGKNLECKIYGPKSDKYDKIEIKSWVVDSSNGVKAEAERVYYKDNNIIDKKRLPSSSYKAK